MNRKNRPLIFGILTILCWGSLATFGKLLVHLPPFYILGISFLIGSLPAWFRPHKMFPSVKILIWGVCGYFGYHFLLFYAFRFAPALEANLINYLWPVIMVIISPVFFPESKLRSYHVAGAVLAVIGSVVLVFGRGGELKREYLFGYLLALGAALTWPLYSIGKKKMKETSVWAIGGFCLVAGLLCLITHYFLEPRVVPETNDLWKLILMGLGPFGMAFYFWDMALQQGDAKVMGALAYLTPVISTLGLIFFANQAVAPTTLIAMTFIIGGASVGLLDFLPWKR